MTVYYDNHDVAAKHIINHLGKVIVMGIPLGIGKPVGLLNALYRLASADPSISLTILTGLTLARPELHSELEKRFLEPILDKLLAGYIEPLYEKPRLAGQLPKNIKVIEFFFAPGKYLHHNNIQQDFNSSMYTNVINDTLNYSINLLAQQVSRSSDNHYSLSSNADLFRETAKQLQQSAAEGKKIAIVAEVNLNLPLMTGDALVDPDMFTDILDTKKYSSLFAIPHPELSIEDHLIGLYSSALIKDGGCLQIGIGKFGDAIANALILRHQHNDLYRNIISQLSDNKFDEIIKTYGSQIPFEEGLYASTEMLSDGYMHLYQANILKKRVFDHIDLQRSLNRMKSSSHLPALIDCLIEDKVINSLLSADDFIFLKKYGIISAEIGYENGHLLLPSGETIKADFSSSQSKAHIIEKCLGSALKDGKIIHAGFFIGSHHFYQQLRNLTNSELNSIEMTSISRTNTLCWSHELSALQRQDARFINAGMMMTLSGSTVSDGLINWQEVSGVGGQADFAIMAQKLLNARFIINCRSTRKEKNNIRSNILWEYPNVTLPRYLRDLFITEYGIADCRGKTDVEVMKEILNITDSRFQMGLLKLAKKSGKIPPHYDIPEQFQHNLPDQFLPVMNEFTLQGYCKPYPFGTDLTNDEIILKKALGLLNDLSTIQLILFAIMAFLSIQDEKRFGNYLIRMGLLHPKTIKEFFYKKILVYSIRKIIIRK